jgi:rod shape-determining protein MreC
VVLVVAGLIYADFRLDGMARARSVLSNVATPLYWVADIPARISEWSDTNIRSRNHLLEDNDRLRQENLLLSGRSQQLSALMAENTRLRALLNSTALLRNDVLIAELIGVSPDPVRHQMILNKGASEGVYVGQPLIDEEGLLGQVVEVSELSSRVLLITDATHALPVQVNRNGVRAIAEGTGALGSLEIHHVAATTDIEEGDLLVSSGLGGRFPVGYPVAQVSKVVRDPGQAFATVEARPVAALDRSRHVLLVFTDQSERAR